MKRVRKWLFALLTGVMVLGGSVACFAKTTTFTSQYDGKRYQIIIDDSALKQYPYWYLKFYHYKGVNSFRLYMTDKPLYIYETSSDGRMICFEDTHYQIFSAVLENNVLDFSSLELVDTSKMWNASGMSQGTCCFNIYDGSTDDFVYSSAEIMKVDYGGESGKWTVNGSFFYPPLAEVALELPMVVENQVGMILPTAVCCLALLIGFLILLPRLKRFL